MFIEAIRRGLHDPIEWTVVQTTHGGHQAAIQVTTDAIKLLGVRIDVTARGAQRIADMLDAWLPTPRILQAIWEQADVRITACNSTADAHMADTARMLQHSRCVDERGGGKPGLYANVGKHWVLSNRLDGHPLTAANYGWFRPHDQPLQTVGTRHDILHTDYSQVLRLVHPKVVVNGNHTDVREVARSHELWGLVSDEGPLRVLRLPIHEEAGDARPPVAGADALVTAPPIDPAAALVGAGEVFPLDAATIPATTQWLMREWYVANLALETRLPHAEVPDLALVSRGASLCGEHDVFADLLAGHAPSRRRLEGELGAIRRGLRCGRALLPWLREGRSFSLVFMGPTKTVELDLLRLPPPVRAAQAELTSFAPLRVPPPGARRAHCMDDHGAARAHCSEGGRSPTQVELPGGGVVSAYAENWPHVARALSDPSPAPEGVQQLLGLHDELKGFEHVTVGIGKRCRAVLAHALTPRALLETDEQAFVVYVSEHAAACARGRSGSLDGGSWHDVFIAADEAGAAALESKIRARLSRAALEVPRTSPKSPEEKAYLETQSAVRKRLPQLAKVERDGARIDVRIDVRPTEAEKLAVAPHLDARRRHVAAAARVIALLERGELPSEAQLAEARGDGPPTVSAPRP